MAIVFTCVDQSADRDDNRDDSHPSHTPSVPISARHSAEPFSDPVPPIHLRQVYEYPQDGHGEGKPEVGNLVPAFQRDVVQDRTGTE